MQRHTGRTTGRTRASFWLSSMIGQCVLILTLYRSRLVGMQGRPFESTEYQLLACPKAENRDARKNICPARGEATPCTCHT